MEWVRPIEASRVPIATRSAADRMARYVERDLSFNEPLRIAWFEASEIPLSHEEWADPVIDALNSTFEAGSGLRGKTFDPDPTLLWCRSDLSPHMAARTIAHEARHAWQCGQPIWKRPAQVPDAHVYLAEHASWKRKREEDAESYAEFLAEKATEIADESLER